MSWQLLRRLAAVLVLGFYAYFFYIQGKYLPPMVTNLLWAISGLYGVALLGVALGWFWGRWFARGLSYWGIVVGLIMMWQLGLENFLLIWAGSNAAVALLLAGDGMASRFDGRLDWRARFHLDENGVERLGKSVTRAGMSLPWLLLWLLAPRPAETGALLPLALAGVGFWGLLRARTWGLLALGGASVASVAQLAVEPSRAPIVGVLAAATLAAAVAPFAKDLVARIRA